MTHLVFGHDETVINWALEREPEGFAFAASWAVGIVDHHGALRGAFSITQNSPTGVVIGVESDGVLTRRALRGIFAFIFENLGATRCEMVTRRTNKSMKKHAPKTLGFRFEGVRRDWYGQGEDALAFVMTPSTCKWIEGHEFSIQDSKAA